MDHHNHHNTGAHHEPMVHHDHSHHSHHDKHEGHSPEMFKTKFWWSSILTVPTVLYSHMVQKWTGIYPPEFFGSEYIPLIFGTALFFYSGTVFIKGAWAELKSRQPGMMTLIAQAIIIAYVYSVATTFFLVGEDFFWELATLITIMILGHWLEMRAVANAQGALNELAKLLPDQAELKDGRQVSLSELKIGDIVIVRPGAKVAADGKVLSGKTEVNEAMITGESKMVSKDIGDNVIAGTINGSGALEIEVQNVGDNTMLAGIMRLVAQAQTSRSKAQVLADRAAFYLTIVAMLAGLGTLVFWLATGASAVFALERTVTVLIIACPHALGVAIPLVISISTTLAAKKGLLVRDRMALESARNLNIVVFDKTGTLTLGKQGVADVYPGEGLDQASLLALAGAAEELSEHSIGKAILEKAKSMNLNLPKAAGFNSLAGKGVVAVVDGKEIKVGGPQLLNESNVQLSADLAEKSKTAGEQGKAVITVLQDNTVIGLLTIADQIKPESSEAVEGLKRLGIKPVMLTGDSQAVASYVASQLGIEEFYAEVLPGHKSQKVIDLQQQGYKVAMVGDGVNDAPALLQSDLGVAVGAGTDVAIESADVILANDDPRMIAKIIALSKASYRKMQQNLFWATGYNLLAIPLAAGVFGIILAPALGAVLMSLSTIIVAINAQLLRSARI